jgi:phosphate transport system protein
MVSSQTPLRVHFDRELARLTEKVLEMGSRARQSVSQAMIALVDGNDDLAREVIAGDMVINDMRFVIEKMCYGLLALEQPVAGDMRAIVAALTIVNDLERIGDHGKRIAATSLRMSTEPRSVLPILDLQRLANLALTMLDRSLASIVSRDVVEAEAVCRLDDQADGLYKQIFNVTLSYMLENPKLIGAGTYIIQIAHELERVADRATNIAERSIYAATGQLVDLNV